MPFEQSLVLTGLTPWNHPIQPGLTVLLPTNFWLKAAGLISLPVRIDSGTARSLGWFTIGVPESKIRCLAFMARSIAARVPAEPGLRMRWEL